MSLLGRIGYCRVLEIARANLLREKSRNIKKRLVTLPGSKAKPKKRSSRRRRKKKSEGMDLAGPMLQVNEAQNGDEEDNAPQSYICNAKDVINLKIVFTARDLEPDRAQRSFKPELVYSVFNNSNGVIFGYRNLNIDIYFMANSAECFVDIQYSAVIDGTMGPPRDDILGKLSTWLPEKYYTDHEEFLPVIENEDHSRIFGRVIDTFEVYNTKEDTIYNYVITQCSVTEPGFAEFHSRFESFIVWYIEAASQIDVSDPLWMFFYVYEERLKPDGSHEGFYPVGYCTVYKFFHYPDKVRTRIAQFFILPPCQRTGVGRKLLRATYKVIYELPNVIDITVEDPCNAFTRMRDLIDCQLLQQLESFKYPAIYESFTNQVFVEANAQYKFNKLQCRRVYEILRMACILSREDADEMPRLYREIVSRLEGRLVREQQALTKKGFVMPPRTHCKEFIYQPVEARRAFTRNVDAYFREIKTFAQYLNSKNQASLD